MSSVERFRYFLEVASYNVPEDDMYAAGSVDRSRNDMMDRAVSKKNIGTLAAGTAAAASIHKLSKPFSDKNVPLRKQKIRSAAVLGAGLYAAKKARDYFNRPKKS